MVVLVAAVVWLVFGPSSLWWIIPPVLAVVVFRPQIPLGWVLAMYGAQPLPEHAAPDLHAYVQALAARAGLTRTPMVFYLPTRLTNAFSIGSGDRSAVVVSDGLLRQLSERQVVAVLAHEISHIRSGDTRVMNLADALGRVVHLLSWLGVISLLFGLPLAGSGDPRLLEISIVLIAGPTVFTLYPPITAPPRRRVHGVRW